MLIFIDESGNFRNFISGVNNFGERFVTLAAVVFEDKEYKKFKNRIKEFRLTYQKYLKDNEIKSHSIRRSNPRKIDLTDKHIYGFYKYKEKGERAYRDFCNDLKEVVSDTEFKIISVSTDKVVAQKLYPHVDILTTLLGDLWERIFICHHINKVTKSRILFDPQMSLNDQTLKDSYHNFLKNGSWFVDKDSIAKANLYKNVFSPNSEESLGIQLADYCAYPIKRQAESQNHKFFNEVIKPKLHKNMRDISRNKYIMMGVKISLNR